MQKAEFVDRVRSCERRLYRVARTMLRSEADCEDAVQEALLKAWSAKGTLRESAYFETWLIRILINECRAVYRRRRLGEAELTDNIAQPVSDDAGLMQALKTLPEKQRIAIELHCIEGYSVREISNILRVPEGTVKWRLKRARDQLKDTLEREGLL